MTPTARRCWGAWPAAADNLAGQAELSLSEGNRFAVLVCGHEILIEPEAFPHAEPIKPAALLALLRRHGSRHHCRCALDLVEGGRLMLEALDRQS